jgi:hypothetical protein
MSLTQFKGLYIHFYKFIDHGGKINIISIQTIILISLKGKENRGDYQ